MLGDIGKYGNYLVATIFFVVGLILLDVIPLPFSGPGQLGMKRKGMLAALILGLVFAIAIGTCTFAYMAPMLAMTFKTAATNLFYGIFFLLSYGVGHCSVIVLAGTCTEPDKQKTEYRRQKTELRLPFSVSYLHGVISDSFKKNFLKVQKILLKLPKQNLK